MKWAIFFKMLQATTPPPHRFRSYIGSTNFSFFGVNGSTGAALWRFDAGNAFISSAAIGGDGTIYAGNLDGTVYAWGPGSAAQ